jgi:DNA-binding MarR family transcriptional regulator
MSTEIGRRIIQYFRDFQKLNRFIVLDSSPAISLSAIHALIEIDAQPGISIGSLSLVLDMPRTSVATIVESLRRRRLVRNIQSKKDKRYHALYATQTGRKYLQRDDAVAERMLRWLLEPLSSEQQDELRMLFRAVADGCGLEDCPARPGEHQIRKELRRSTRALRLIHPDFFGSGMGSPEWQLLTLILTRSDALRISQVASELHIPLSSTTTILARLKKRGFVATTRDPSDKRASRVAVRTDAKEYLGRIEAQMSHRIGRAVSSANPSLLNAQLKAFSMVVTGRSMPEA